MAAGDKYGGEVLTILNSDGHFEVYDVSTPELMTKRMKEIVNIFCVTEGQPLSAIVEGLLKKETLTWDEVSSALDEYYEIPMQRGTMEFTRVVDGKIKKHSFE